MCVYIPLLTNPLKGKNSPVYWYIDLHIIFFSCSNLLVVTKGSPFLPSIKPNNYLGTKILSISLVMKRGRLY